MGERKDFRRNVLFGGLAYAAVIVLGVINFLIVDLLITKPDKNEWWMGITQQQRMTAFIEIIATNILLWIGIFFLGRIKVEVFQSKGKTLWSIFILPLIMTVIMLIPPIVVLLYFPICGTLIPFGTAYQSPAAVILTFIFLYILPIFILFFGALSGEVPDVSEEKTNEET